MYATNQGNYQRLYALEQGLVRIAKVSANHISLTKLITPWLFFWIFIGGFFFTFQSFLLLYPLSWVSGANVELIAAVVGLTFALIAGTLIALLLPNDRTNWRISGSVFILWMVLPTIFPIIFLVGIFMQKEWLVDFQSSPWRAVIEYLFFGGGLLILAASYKKLRLTQGSATVMLIALLFILKSLLSSGYYLAEKCPKTTLDERMAYLSNTAEEVKLFRSRSAADNFYHTSFGQFVCTRTQEDLFR